MQTAEAGYSDAANLSCESDDCMRIVALSRLSLLRRILAGIVAGLSIAACQDHNGAAAADMAAPGMTFAEVEARLGPPDRKAVLEGKDIEEVGDVAAADAAGKRTVYIYDKKQLRVWFKDGRVTAVTPAASGPENDTADDH